MLVTSTNQGAIDLSVTPPSHPISIKTSNDTSASKPTEIVRTRLAPTLLGQSNTSISFTPSMSANQKVVSAAPAVRPMNPSGQSLVMLHVNKSGEAYLVPANTVVTQANNKVLPVKLSATAPATNGSQSSLGSDDGTMEITAVAPAAVLADSPQSALTLAKMVCILY